MSKFNDNDIRELANIIRDIAWNAIRKFQQKYRFEYCFDGVVTNVDNDNNTATVDIRSNILENLPNNTGIPLEIGDVVRVFSKEKFLSDAYIGIKVIMR